MNRDLNLKRLGRQVQAYADAAAPHATGAAEGQELAREVVAAFRAELERQRRLPAAKQDNDPNQPPEDWQIKSIRNQEPDQVTFFDIERLSRLNPDEAAACWNDVKSAARRSLDNGWIAARALEFMGGNAWERACFLAIRGRLIQAWAPRHGAEEMLIDEIAQYEMMRLRWVAILSFLSRQPETITSLRQRNLTIDDQQDQTCAEATFAAGRMVDRLQRLSQNAQRTLLNMRRNRSALIVQRSGQMNIAVGPQMNVAASVPAEVVADDEFCPEEP